MGLRCLMHISTKLKGCSVLIGGLKLMPCLQLQQQCLIHTSTTYSLHSTLYNYTTGLTGPAAGGGKGTKVNKGFLVKLRKKTGFPFVKCQKALQICNNDVIKAEAWLKEQAQKEGWQKAQKVQGRKTTHGLIGLLNRGPSAVMIEVNCETDFVAKTDKFRDFVQNSLTATLDHRLKQHAKNKQIIKDCIDADQLKTITHNGKTLEDLRAICIGEVGENLTLRRGIFYVAPPGSYVGSSVHPHRPSPEGQCKFGQYGALLSFTQYYHDPEAPLKVYEFGRQLAAHVIGMNPQTIHPVEGAKTDSAQTNEVDPPSADGEVASDGEEADSVRSEDDDEASMLKQKFLLDPTITVSDLLQLNCVELSDFVRFQCGEDLHED